MTFNELKSKLNISLIEVLDGELYEEHEIVYRLTETENCLNVYLYYVNDSKIGLFPNAIILARKGNL